MEPRAGWWGAWDRLVGPGATRSENLGTAWVAFVGAGAAGGLAWLGGGTVLQIALAAGLGLDVVGGVWVNATTTARRWYHRPGGGRLASVTFAAVHVHPFVVAWLFGAPLGWATVLYGGCLLATALVHRMPRSLQTPTALTACVAILTVATAAGDAPLVPWFAPALTLKLVAAHAVAPRGHG